MRSDSPNCCSDLALARNRKPRRSEFSRKLLAWKPGPKSHQKPNDTRLRPPSTNPDSQGVRASDLNPAHTHTLLPPKSSQSRVSVGQSAARHPGWLSLSTFDRPKTEDRSGFRVEGGLRFLVGKLQGTFTTLHLACRRRLRIATFQHKRHSSCDSSWGRRDQVAVLSFEHSRLGETNTNNC